MATVETTYQIVNAGLIGNAQGIAKMWANVRSSGFIVRVTLFERYNFEKKEIESWVGLPRRERDEPLVLPDGSTRKAFYKEAETPGKSYDRELLNVMKAAYRRLQEHEAAQAQQGSPGYRDMGRAAKTEPEVHDIAGGFFEGYDESGGIIRSRRTARRVEGNVFRRLGTKDFVADTAPPGETLMFERSQEADGMSS